MPGTAVNNLNVITTAIQERYYKVSVLQMRKLKYRGLIQFAHVSSIVTVEPGVEHRQGTGAHTLGKYIPITNDYYISDKGSVTADWALYTRHP